MRARLAWNGLEKGIFAGIWEHIIRLRSKMRRFWYLLQVCVFDDDFYCLLGGPRLTVRALVENLWAALPLTAPCVVHASRVTCLATCCAALLINFCAHRLPTLHALRMHCISFTL